MNEKVDEKLVLLEKSLTGSVRYFMKSFNVIKGELENLKQKTSNSKQN